MQTDVERIATNLVRNEVHLCLSSMVATLAQGANASTSSSELESLCDQAAELCAPLDDWEEAAIQDGAKITLRDDGWVVLDQQAKPALWEGVYESAELAAAAYCAAHDLEPYQREIFEHWAVSERLAEDLQSIGERVDTDFAGLCVWGRTTTGQMIEMDSIMLRVAQLVHDRTNALFGTYPGEKVA